MTIIILHQCTFNYSFAVTLCNVLIILGVGGVDGDGDVTRTENLREFADFVRRSSEGGVHFAMADGVSY